MRVDSARQCLTEIGCSADKREQILSLLAADRLPEARQRMRGLRCGLMEELHVTQRRVDQLDWLIRETEKADGA